MSTATIHATTSTTANFPKRDGLDIEPDEEWKAKLKQNIEEGLTSMVKDAKDNLEQSLRQPGITDDDRERFKAEYNSIMKNVRKLATESYHAELDRERNERRWAAGMPMNSGWSEALQQEQKDIMEAAKRNQEAGVSTSPTTSPIEDRRRTSVASRAAAERATSQTATALPTPPTSAAQDIKRNVASDFGISASPAGSPIDDRRFTSASSSSASRAAAIPVAPSPAPPQEAPKRERTFDPPTKPRYSSDNASSAQIKEEHLASVGQSSRKVNGARPTIPQAWAPPPTAEHDTEEEPDMDTEDEPMVKRGPRSRPSMEMNPIQETEGRPTEPPSRSGSISERNSARSPPKAIPVFWKPSVTPEEDAATSRPSVTPVRRNSTASLQSNGSAGRRPSIVQETIPERPETIPNPSSKFTREKEPDKPWSAHDNVREREKQQLRSKLSREDVSIKSPSSPYGGPSPYQGTSSPRRVASKPNLNNDSPRPSGERRAPPKPVHADSLEDELPHRPPKIYHDRPSDFRAAPPQPYVRSASGASYDERTYQPGVADNPHRRLSSKPSVSFSEDSDRQSGSGRYAVPHHTASPLSASRPPERYATPPSASRSRRDHVSDDEYDEEMYDDRTYGRRPPPEEMPEYQYGNSRPMPSRQSSYKRDEERRRNDDDYSRHLYATPPSNPISVPRRSPNVIDEPVMSSWKDWSANDGRRPSESRHDYPRGYSGQFHPPMWPPSSSYVESPAHRAFVGKKPPPPKVDSDVEDYDEDPELHQLEEETLQKEEEVLMQMEDMYKKMTAEAHMKEREAQKRAIEIRRKELEMKKSQTEARMWEAVNRAKLAEQKLMEQKAKEKEEELRRRAEETEQKEEAARVKEEAALLKEEEARQKEEAAKLKEEAAKRKEEEAKRKEDAVKRKERETRRAEEEMKKRAEEMEKREEELRRKEEDLKRWEEKLALQEEKLRKQSKQKKPFKANKRPTELVEHEDEDEDEGAETLRQDQERAAEAKKERARERARLMEEKLRLQKEEEEREKLDQEEREREQERLEQEEREKQEQEERERQEQEDLERQEQEEMERQERERQAKEKERIRKEKEKEERDEIERLRILEEEGRNKSQQNWERYEQNRVRTEQQAKEKEQREARFRREQESAREQEQRRAQDEARATADRKRPESFDPEAAWSAALNSSSTGSVKTPQRSASANISADRNSTSSTNTWNSAWSSSSTGSAWSSSTRATTASGTSSTSASQSAWSSTTKPRASSTSSGAFNPTGASATGASPIPSTPLSEAEWKRRQEEQHQKRQEQFRREQERMEAARLSKMAQMSAEDVGQLIEHHERVWSRLPTLAELHWSDFPWPMFKRPSSAEDITYSGISAYIHSKHQPDKDKPVKDRIKDHIRRWHPDRFETKLLSKVVEDDKEKVKEGAGAVVRHLNELLTRTNSTSGLFN